MHKLNVPTTEAEALENLFWACDRRARSIISRAEIEAQRPENWRYGAPEFRDFDALIRAANAEINIADRQREQCVADWFRLARKARGQGRA